MTLDGNFGVYNYNYDAKRILRTIREKAPEVKVVGLATESLEGVDVDLTKEQIYNLGSTVTNL